jgi:hypothetical protein
VNIEIIRATLDVARDPENQTPAVVWRSRYACDVGDLLVENERLRQVERDYERLRRQIAADAL